MLDVPVVCDTHPACDGQQGILIETTADLLEVDTRFNVQPLRHHIYLTASEPFFDLTTFASRMLIAKWHAILVNTALHGRPTDVTVCN